MNKIETSFAGNSLLDRFAYAVARTLVCLVTRTWTRMRIEGREHLPPTGPYVLAPVHRSYIDTPITSCVTRRRVRFMGKQEVWKYPFTGWLMSTLGGFPVARGSADREALKRSIAVLEGGEPLVLFPEGERKDGPLVQPLFDGAAYVASRAGVPIIPVGIGGSARVMPRKAKFLHPGRVHVIVGEPLWAEVGASGRVSRRGVTDLTERLHAELQVLFDRAQSIVG